MQSTPPDDLTRLRRIQQLSAELEAAITSAEDQRELAEQLAREASAFAESYVARAPLDPTKSGGPNRPDQ